MRHAWALQRAWALMRAWALQQAGTSKGGLQFAAGVENAPGEVGYSCLFLINLTYKKFNTARLNTLESWRSIVIGNVAQRRFALKTYSK